MNTAIWKNRGARQIVGALCLLVGVSLRAQTTPSVTVTLAPGDDIEAAVLAAPEGATFLLLPGVYRLQSVEPKNGDVFTGQGAVILNGSQVLSFNADPAGSGLWVANAVANKSTQGRCQSAHPMCGYFQDLFIDNQLQTPVSSLASITPGSWYYDRSHNVVYVPKVAARAVVELGMRHYAFFGSATGVQISHMTVEKYAPGAQFGAIGGNRLGHQWVVDNAESRWNHGAGINLGPGSQISNSFIHHNAQLGISMGGANCKAIHNEISWNNYAGFDPGWEAGGTKFWATTNLAVQSNYVHDNSGPGLWTDTDNVGTLYENNTVINNANEGIKHEISYNAVIRYNTVRGNGNTSTVWLWNAQIEIQNSSNVEVYQNIVEVPSRGGNGITVINQNRGTGALGPRVAANNYVHDNTVAYTGSRGASGIVDDTRQAGAVGNQFDHNHYKLSSGDGGSKNWSWFGGLDWQALLAAGQESHGSCCK